MKKRNIINLVYGKLSQKYNTIRLYISKAKAYREFYLENGINNPYVIIGVPGCLHVVDLCLKYVPKDVDVIFISNGLEKWEEEWARKNLDVRSIIWIDKMLSHGDVLDLMFDKFQRPFGILDYDCFVFNRSYFYKLREICDKSLYNGLFLYENKELKLKFPETFMIFFNTELINTVRKKYKVKSSAYNIPNISKEILRVLREIGIDQQQFPENHKNYFDTLRLLLSLGYVEGYQPQFVEEFPGNVKPNCAIFHVGGVSCSGIPKTKWGTRGVYLWRRVLEECLDDDLKDRYREKYGSYTADDLRRVNAKLVAEIGSEYFEFVEEIIKFKFLSS